MRRLYLETMEEILRRNPKVIVDDRLQGLVPFLNLGGAGQARRPPASGRATAAAPGCRPAAAGGRPDEPLSSSPRSLLGRPVVAAASLFTVHQTQQVLITQFGEPKRVVDKPGLN